MASKQSRSAPSSFGTGSAVGSTPIVGVDGLDRIEQAVNGLRAGVVELEQSPSYLMLADAAAGTRTHGEYASAVAKGRDLWPLLEALGKRIDDARRFARQHSLTATSTGRRVHELNQLLGMPIDVSGVADPSTVRGPLSITAAIDLVHRLHDAVHKGVSRVDQVWLAVLPRVEAARETLAKLDGDAEQLGVREPLIGRARATAEDLAERLLADPISVTVEDGPALDRLVGDAARQISTMRTAHDNLDSDLGRTGEMLAGLRALRSRAEAAAAEARHKIVDPSDLVIVPGPDIIDGPGGLADQLDKLFELARASSVTDGTWTQQRSVLDRWLTTAARLEQQLAEAERRNRGDLAKRDELRGRLQAFQAKMAATGKAEAARSMDLAEAAWGELYTAPTDLEAAAEAINSLAAELRKP